MADLIIVEGRAMASAEALALAARHLQRDEHRRAEAICREVLKWSPNNAAALLCLGTIAFRLGNFKEAEFRLRKALAVAPTNAQGHYLLGRTLRVLDRIAEAVASYREALRQDPRHAEASNYLGNALLTQGQVDEALECYLRAIELRPDYPEPHNNAANIYNLQGNVEQAVESYRRALALRPELAAVHSNILLSMNYSPSFSQRAIFEESLAWDKAHRYTGSSVAHQNLRDTERRLKVGYLSPDFCNTSVSHFCTPLFAAHNREKIELHCYADLPHPDQVSQEIERLADRWLNVFGWSDQQLATRIREDRIDILVDLSGHTGRNRLPVFTAKPAPLQVNWLGYPNTTGLSAMDYRLTDLVADPVGEADLLHSERLVRLPDGFLCYRPPSAAPVPAPPPRSSSGCITFGSFNNLPKLTPQVVELWSRLLQRVPGSRLLLKNRYFADRSTRRRYLDFFAASGVEPERLELMAAVPSSQEHLELYKKMDIALDPFPYNGTTTTFDSLYMGVPVVTLLGDRHAARVGGSILSHVGLGELIAGSPEEYLAIASALAADHDRLDSLRRGLRPTLSRSPLCDAASFAAAVEKNYREIWRTWCTQKA